jgi:hypothetical protein
MACTKLKGVYLAFLALPYLALLAGYLSNSIVSLHVCVQLLIMATSLDIH